MIQPLGAIDQTQGSDAVLAKCSADCDSRARHNHVGGPPATRRRGALGQRRRYAATCISTRLRQDESCPTQLVGSAGVPPARTSYVRTERPHSRTPGRRLSLHDANAPCPSGATECSHGCSVAQPVEMGCAFVASPREGRRKTCGHLHSRHGRDVRRLPRPSGAIEHSNDLIPRGAHLAASPPRCSTRGYIPSPLRGGLAGHHTHE